MLEADNGASPVKLGIMLSTVGCFQGNPVFVFLSGPSVHVWVFVSSIGCSENDKDETIP